MISFGFWIARKLLGKVVTEQQARKIGFWAALPLVLIGLGLLLWGGKALYDRGVVERYKDQRQGQIAVGARKADEAADVAQANRLAEVEAENARLENAMGQAKAADPVKGQTEVGPVQQSYFDNLPEKKRR